MPDERIAESEEFTPKKGGRPKGHRLSEASKVKIAEARQRQEQERRARANKILPATFPTLSEEMRAAITERDLGKDEKPACRSCGDPGPDLQVHTFIRGLTDVNAPDRDPELSAVMCSFCRKFADDFEATSMASLLRERW